MPTPRSITPLQEAYTSNPMITTINTVSEADLRKYSLMAEEIITLRSDIDSIQHTPKNSGKDNQPNRSLSSL